jgi:hypothetical protein
MIKPLRDKVTVCFEEKKGRCEKKMTRRDAPGHSQFH